jgi:hypothetical protein
MIWKCLLLQVASFACYPLGYVLGDYFHLPAVEYYHFNAYILFVHVIAIVISFIGFKIVFSTAEAGKMRATVGCTCVFYLWGYYGAGWYLLWALPAYIILTVSNFFQIMIS